jgi:hypothetical protein
MQNNATLTSSQFTAPCYYRVGGVFCANGYLHFSQAEIADQHPVSMDGEDAMWETISFQRVLVEGVPVPCPACEGKGIILTDHGKDLLAFFEKFLRPRVHEMCGNYLDEKLFG